LHKFWFITEIRFLCQTEYTVGRKDVDVLLRDDPSISRKHAKIFIEFKEEQVVSYSNLLV